MEKDIAYIATIIRKLAANRYVEYPKVLKITKKTAHMVDRTLEVLEQLEMVKIVKRKAPKPRLIRATNLNIWDSKTKLIKIGLGI